MKSINRKTYIIALLAHWIVLILILFLMGSNFELDSPEILIGCVLSVLFIWVVTWLRATEISPPLSKLKKTLICFSTLLGYFALIPIIYLSFKKGGKKNMDEQKIKTIKMGNFTITIQPEDQNPDIYYYEIRNSINPNIIFEGHEDFTTEEDCLRSSKETIKIMQKKANQSNLKI